MILAYENFDALGHVLVNEFMPPNSPGSLSEDYYELIQCWINGPENTDGCDWIIPPGGGCDSQVLSISDDIIPDKVSLYQNYPNPFNPFTNIEYEISNKTFVRVTIYDITGNLVRNMVSQYQTSGRKSVRWNGSNNKGQPVASGVYFYSIRAGDIIKTNKMSLIK